MAVNVLIKEVENLNISNDENDETEARHEVEIVGDGPDSNENDIKGPLGPTELPLGNTKSGKNVLTKTEIADIVKKQLENSNAQFVEMAADDIVGMFDEFIDKGVDVSKFDYKIYSRDFYAERFPGFEPRFYECLERASAEKFIDQTDKKDWRNYTYEAGNYTVTFGGDEDPEGAHGVAEQHQETKDDDSIETYSDAVTDLKE